MEFNFDNNANNDSNLSDLVQYNQRAATLISNGETLIPLHVLQKYIPALFENRTPHSNTYEERLVQEDTLLCKAYQPPDDLLCKASVDAMHTTNNAESEGTNENWYNGEVHDTSTYPVDQSSTLGSELESYPSNYCTSTDFDISVTCFEDPQSFSEPDWINASSSASFTDSLYQYPDQNQFTDEELVNQYSQSSFENNAWGVNDMTPPPLSDATLCNCAISDWFLANGTYTLVVAPGLSVRIGPDMQNMHTNETQFNMASALAAGVANNTLSLALGNPYSTPTSFPESSNSLCPTNQDTLDTFPTPSSPTDTHSSISRSAFSALTFEEPDGVPGLYEQIGGTVWRCTCEKW